jgi:hypothetical protein
MGLAEYRDPILKALIDMLEADGPPELSRTLRLRRRTRST